MSDEETSSYVDSLERQNDSGVPDDDDVEDDAEDDADPEEEATGESLAAELARFLRERDAENGGSDAEGDTGTERI